MIAVAADHPVELSHVLRTSAEVPVFIHYQHPEAISGVKKLRCWSVVCAPISIRSHLFETTDAEVPQGVGNRNTNAGMILVIRRALQLHRLVIQKEALVRIEANRA